MRITPHDGELDTDVSAQPINRRTPLGQGDRDLDCGGAPRAVPGVLAYWLDPCVLVGSSSLVVCPVA